MTISETIPIAAKAGAIRAAALSILNGCQFISAITFIRVSILLSLSKAFSSISSFCIKAVTPANAATTPRTKTETAKAIARPGNITGAIVNKAHPKPANAATNKTIVPTTSKLISISFTSTDAVTFMATVNSIRAPIIKVVATANNANCAI